MAATTINNTTPISFLDLGEDIILFHIVPHLDYHDIVSLSKIQNRQIASLFTSSYFYQLLFQKQFTEDSVNPVELTLNNWKQLYKLRLNSHLYTWGKNSQFRLGYGPQDVPPENLVHHSDIVRPTEVRALTGNAHHDRKVVLADVSASGVGFHVLTGNGSLFELGRSPQRPRRRIENLFSVPNDSLSIVLKKHGDDITKMTDFYTPETLEEMKVVFLRSNHIAPIHLPRSKFDKDLKIISINSGRIQVVALDSKNQLWEFVDPKLIWDPGMIAITRKQTATKITFVNPVTNRSIIEDPKKNIITKISGGWGNSGCIIHGIGLVVWNFSYCKDSELETTEANVEFKVIKNTSTVGTKNQVIDFFIGECFIVYITADGKLHRIDIPDDEAFKHLGSLDSYEILSFNSYLDKYNASTSSALESNFFYSDNNIKRKFTKIVGTFRTFAVFTNHDTVLLGTRDSTAADQFNFETGTFKRDAQPVIHEELQNKNCINVAMGDYHCLALFANGDIYAWGLESKCCGSLGLGRLDEAKEKYSEDVVREEGAHPWSLDMRVLKPVKVDLKGNVALAIAASGWHSSAILASRDEH